MKITAIILASLMVIATFVPWASSSASAGSFSTSQSLSGINTDPGLIGLLMAIVAIVLPCINKTRRLSIIPGAMTLICTVWAFVALKDADNLVGSAGSFGVKASVDPGWGLFLFAICSIVYVVLSAIMIKKS